MLKPAQRLAHLEQLLKALPNKLPYQPEGSRYVFQANMDELEDRGVYGVTVHCLEIAFQTHALRVQGKDLVFSKRGPRLDTDLVELLRWTLNELLTDEEWEAFCDAWVGRLIQAAMMSGAQIPSLKRCVHKHGY
jgi:hypothetical protein